MTEAISRTTEPPSKTCTRCGQAKGLESFYRVKGGKFGRSSWCSDCVKKRKSERYAEEPHRYKEYAREYRKKNLDKVNTRERAYRSENAELLRERSRVYREANPEKRKAARQNYYERNRNKENLQSKAWRDGLSENQKQKRQKDAKEYYLKNRDKFAASYLKQRYGIGLSEYDQMFALQEGCCAICGTSQNGKRQRLCVDHHHTSKKVRGLLCFKCNTVIGLARESPEVLQAAINYLRKHS